MLTFACAALPLTYIASAQAAEKDSVLSPYADFSAGYDSNFLRRSDEAPVPSIFDDTDTTFTTIAAGLKGQKAVGRQRFTFGGELARRTYQSIDVLDHTGGNAELAWDIHAGPQWGGRLDYNYARGLRNFEFLDVLDPSFRNTGRVGLRVHRKLGLRQQVELFGQHTDIEFDGDEAQGGNRRVDRDNVGLRYSYAFSKRTKAGVQAQTEARRGDETTENGDFDHSSIGAFLDWSLSNKSDIQAELTYANRDLELTGGNDFSGVLGQLSYRWQASEKSLLDVSYARRLSNLADNIPGIAVINEVGVQHTWRATEKLEFGLNARLDNRDFRSDLGREDRLITTGVSLDWRLPRSMVLGMQVEHRDREGNSVLSDYNGTSVSLAFRVNLR